MRRDGYCSSGRLPCTPLLFSHHPKWCVADLAENGPTRVMVWPRSGERHTDCRRSGGLLPVARVMPGTGTRSGGSPTRVGRAERDRAAIGSPPVRPGRVGSSWRWRSADDAPGEAAVDEDDADGAGPGDGVCKAGTPAAVRRAGSATSASEAYPRVRRPGGGAGARGAEDVPSPYGPRGPVHRISRGCPGVHAGGYLPLAGENRIRVPRRGASPCPVAGAGRSGRSRSGGTRGGPGVSA